MVNKKRVLIITHEMEPYLEITPTAHTVLKTTSFLNNNTTEVRVLMPRFGNVNERRHRLHEVVRLSGINIIVDEDDYPLIIKVASLPGARLQVYFLENQEFFKRKNDVRDDKGTFYEDNAERMIFFCKGVLETVRKFGWAPDVIICHGWMSSLIPLYGKTAYKTDPIFTNSKFLYSIDAPMYDQMAVDLFNQKASIKRVLTSELEPYGNVTNNDLHKGAIYYSDAVMVQTENLSPELQAAIDSSPTPKPLLVYDNDEHLGETVKDFVKALTDNED